MRKKKRKLAAWSGLSRVLIKKPSAPSRLSPGSWLRGKARRNTALPPALRVKRLRTRTVSNSACSSRYAEEGSHRSPLRPSPILRPRRPSRAQGLRSDLSLPSCGVQPSPSSRPSGDRLPAAPSPHRRPRGSSRHRPFLPTPHLPKFRTGKLWGPLLSAGTNRTHSKQGKIGGRGRKDGVEGRPGP